MKTLLKFIEGALMPVWVLLLAALMVTIFIWPLILCVAVDCTNGTTFVLQLVWILFMFGWINVRQSQ